MCVRKDEISFCISLRLVSLRVLQYNTIYYNGYAYKLMPFLAFSASAQDTNSKRMSDECLYTKHTHTLLCMMLRHIKELNCKPLYIYTHTCQLPARDEKMNFEYLS